MNLDWIADEDDEISSRFLLAISDWRLASHSVCQLAALVIYLLSQIHEMTHSTINNFAKCNTVSGENLPLLTSSVNYLFHFHNRPNVARSQR